MDFGDFTDHLLPAAEIIGGGVLDVFGGSAIGVPLSMAGASQWGAVDQNRSNRQAAADAQTFSANQITQQDTFQANMSNTAYQRQKADMIASGINPMAMNGQSGASSPSGGAATGVKPQYENSMAPGLSSAVALKQAMTAADAQGSQATLNTALATQALQNATTGAASAKQMNVNTTAVQSQLAAIAAKAKADAAKSSYDYKATGYDAIMSRLNRDSGTAKNITQAIPGNIGALFGKKAKPGMGMLEDGTSFNLNTGEIP